MFGQVLDKLDAWFGRAFLFGAYFPSLLFALTNLALVYVFLPAQRPAITSFWEDTAAGKTFDLVVGLAAVAVFAFAATPLIQIVTNWMEGQRMPGWIASVLVIRKSVRQERGAEEQLRLAGNRNALPAINEIEVRLGAARQSGARHHAVRNPTSIDAAQNLLDTLRLDFTLRRPIKAARLVEATAVLESALNDNCAEQNELGLPVSDDEFGYRPVSAEQVKRCEQLAALHLWFVRTLVPYSHAIATYQQEQTPVDPYDRYNQFSLAPTRLGNEAAALRDYCKKRYNIDFDSFWPLFQLAIKDDKLKTAIVNAKTQLDFSVMMFALAVVTAFGWTLALGFWFGDDASLFAGYIGLSLLACWYSQRTVHWNYATFASVVRASIDMARFDVLDALRINPPDTLLGEQQIWDRIKLLIVAHDIPADITFKHPAKS